MRFPAKKNAGCPKAPCDFPPRKDGILCPRRVVLGLPSPSHRVCADGRTYGCTDVRMYGRTDVRIDGHVTITSQPKFLGLIGYHISIAMELRWRALPAGSANSHVTVRPYVRTSVRPSVRTRGLPIHFIHWIEPCAESRVFWREIAC